jgi:NAD(P)-dependent dehydrogenase (short-subunit alcohol dehydrogenase family)
MKPRLFDLTGKVALITGGNKGLGKAMARGFAEAGADIVIAARTEPELKSSLDEILHGTHRCGAYFVCDVAKRDEVKQMAADAITKMGKIDILINNAGTNHPQPIDNISDEVWDRILEINLSSCMALTRALVPGMKERRWGRVVHISSMFGLISKEGRNTYSATKAALLGLCKASALDLGPYGVTVNCLAPGPFLTDLPLSMLSAPEKDAFANRTALGRWGDPKELIGPAILLCSDAGSYITGATLLVDGGYSAR